MIIVSRPKIEKTKDTAPSFFEAGGEVLGGAVGGAEGWGTEVITFSIARAYSVKIGTYGYDTLSITTGETANLC